MSTPLQNGRCGNSFGDVYTYTTRDSTQVVTYVTYMLLRDRRSREFYERKKGHPAAEKIAIKVHALGQYTCCILFLLFVLIPQLFALYFPQNAAF